VLVTHDLELAKRAQRSYEMRQGSLAATALPQAVVELQRRFTPARVRPEQPAPAPARAPIRLGANLWGGVKTFLIAAAVIFAAILAADVGVEKYQAMQVRERAARIAALQHLALNRLRGDVQSVSDLGDGRYELTTYLQTSAARHRSMSWRRICAPMFRSERCGRRCRLCRPIAAQPASRKTSVSRTTAIASIRACTICHNWSQNIWTGSSSA